VHLGVRVAPGNLTGVWVNEGHMAFHQRLDVHGLVLRVDKLGLRFPPLSTLPVVGQLLAGSGVADLQLRHHRLGVEPGPPPETFDLEGQPVAMQQLTQAAYGLGSTGAVIARLAPWMLRWNSSRACTSDLLAPIACTKASSACTKALATPTWPC